MLNRSASLAMSTSVLKALPGKLDIKRHSPSILYLLTKITVNNDVHVYWPSYHMSVPVELFCFIYLSIFLFIIFGGGGGRWGQ